VSEGIDAATSKWIRLRRWDWTLLALAIACFATVPFLFARDVGIGERITQLAPENTWQHRSLKLARYLVEERAYMLFLAILLIWWWRAGISAAQVARNTAGYLLPMGLVAVLVHSSKFIFGRARPSTGQGPYAFHFFELPTDDLDSYPSGHTASYFVFVLLTRLYVPPVMWALLPFALLGSLSRVAQERHFLSDCFGGVGVACLAVFFARAILGPRFYDFPRFGGRVGTGRDDEHVDEQPIAS
jgi:membrane-associated phospholipid phosphatase